MSYEKWLGGVPASKLSYPEAGLSSVSYGTHQTVLVENARLVGELGRVRKESTDRGARIVDKDRKIQELRQAAEEEADGLEDELSQVRDQLAKRDEELAATLDVLKQHAHATGVLAPGAEISRTYVLGSRPDLNVFIDKPAGSTIATLRVVRKDPDGDVKDMLAKRIGVEFPCVTLDAIRREGFEVVKRAA